MRGLWPRACCRGARCTAGCSAGFSTRSPELAGATAAGGPPRGWPAQHKQVEAYEAFCAELGRTRAVALAWLLHQPAVTAPIVGPRTLEQLDGAIAR